MKISEVSKIIGCHNVTLKRWVQEGRVEMYTLTPLGFTSLKYFSSVTSNVTHHNRIHYISGSGQNPETNSCDFDSCK